MVLGDPDTTKKGTMSGLPEFRILSCGVSFDAVLKIDHALVANPDQSSTRAIQIHGHEDYQSNDQGHRNRHREIAPISYPTAESYDPHGQNRHKKKEKQN